MTEPSEPLLPAGKLNKQVIKKFIEFGCLRQLFLYLAIGDPRWMQPPRPLRRAPREGTSPQLLYDMGQDYEQAVYRRLRSSLIRDHVRVAMRVHDEITQTDVSPEGWRRLHEELARTAPLILLEHQWEPPPRFFGELFDPELPQAPVVDTPHGLRPDITLLVPSQGSAARALTSRGARIIEAEDERVAIRFLDIKHSNPEAVGKRQFIELLIYAHAMATYLEDHGLDELFFVELDGHGIWPQRDLHGLRLERTSAIEEACVPMVWDDHAHLYSFVRQTTRQLWARAPLPVEEVDVRIQPACSRCPFIADCKRSLGFDPGHADLEHIDVRLMPYTSPATADQLREMGIHTVEELREREAELGAEQAPTPLYAERPLLKLKAEALAAGQRRLPVAERDHELRHLSVALPRDCEAIITFNAEADPTNDCVFAVASHLDVRVGAQRYGLLHDSWWAAWADLLDRDEPVVEADVERLRDILADDVRAHTLKTSSELDEDSLASLERERLWECARALETLSERGQLSIARDAEAGCWVASHTYSFINRGLEEADERAMARDVVRVLHALFVVTSVYEEMCCVVVERPWGAIEREGPRTAGFYWSGDQLAHLQDLVERHLTHLLTSPAICQQFNELLLLISPSESSVRTVYQDKKLLDVRAFVETTVGLPQIINYTWHEVAEQELHDGARVFERAYWAENFNYMDFLTWHEMLRTRDVSGATRLHEQARLKARTIARLVRHFQLEAGEHGALSRQAKPIPSRQIPWRTGAIGKGYNFVARAWALYSKLSASVQSQQALVTRLTYPAQSIGKLHAARVSRLYGTVGEGGSPQEFTFELRGLSASARFGEGSYVFLIHDSIRDHAFGEYSPSCVILDEMEWDEQGQLYRVRAHVWRDRHLHPYFDEDRALGPGVWYLYPRASDSWSGRLFENRDNLLDRDAIGRSWLGQRLAYRLGLLAEEDPLWAPRSMRFALSHLYMYAPSLLPDLPALEGALRSEVTPAPDTYQEEAIRMALSSPVSCIQGPPGTGKSETIATLIDEFLCRRAPGRPARVLVTSFSYTPLYVVMARLVEQRRADGAPTRAASTAMYFFGSEDRDPGLDAVRRIDPYTRSVDGQKLNRRRKSPRGVTGWRMRLEDLIGDEPFIVFANAHQLTRLGGRTGKRPPKQIFELFHNDFAFDLIVVDEASQVPVDAALASVEMVQRGRAHLSMPGSYEPGDRVEDIDHVEALALEQLEGPDQAPLSASDLTRLVLVGDHNQLPPVQPVDPPEGLRPILSSMFSYYVEHLGVPSSQLAVNYRSRPEVVAYTRHLGLYPRRIEAFHDGERAYPALPAPPEGATGWVRQVLEDARVVSALVHERRFETAVSPLEARMVQQVAGAFYEQLGVDGAARERRFWREDLGIVAPHNAQGRLIIRELMRVLGARSQLAAAELEGCLRETIYTVEKFQGSARTFIIASMGISSVDQLRAEESFIYSMNRLNVLTSRARQKMLMLCSRAFLDYIPRQREVVPAAARAREYALVYCNRADRVQVRNERGELEELSLRWHDPDTPLAMVPRPEASQVEPAAPSGAAGSGEGASPKVSAARLRALLSTVGVDYDELTPEQRAAFADSLDEP